MRILHVIPSVSPLRGGPSAAVIGMVRALRMRGCDAEIACTDDDGPGVLDVPFAQPVERDGARMRFFPRFSPPVAALREFQWSAPLAGWLRRHLREYELVHVHAVFSFASTCAMAMARRMRIPHIVRPIGQISGWSLGRKAAKKRAYLALIEGRNIAAARGVHCVSEAERADVLGFDPRLPAFVAPIGADAPEPRADARAAVHRRFGIPEDWSVVLYLGRLDEKKNPGLLLEAAARLLHGGCAVVIAGLGDPSHEARLRERAAAPDLRGRVHFAGFAAGAEKDALFQGSDLFVLPSEHENFGIAVLEALMAGLPVLVSPRVALADFVRAASAGRVVDATAAALAREFESLLAAGPAPEPERRRIRTAAAAAFSWPSVAARLLDVYTRLLSGRPPE